ncbi:tetratricopeptide repeat protein, partial [Myxococcota bacterium]|nr:tetratricopeptide repeat protein [Myxococcota bacterium]
LVVRGLGASALGPSVLLLALALGPGAARAEGAGPLKSEDREAREGNEHLAAGRAKEAVDAYGRAIKRLGEDPRLVLNRGLASSKAGELDAAVSDLKAAMENGTTPELRGQAAFALGNTYRQLKKWDDAINAYKRALVEDPKQRGARRNLEIAQRQKVIEASQPRDPNKKNDGDKPPPPNQQDGGVPDGGDGDGGGSPDAGPPPNDGGSSGDAGEDPSSGDAGADGGGQGEQQGQDGGSTGDTGAQGSEAPDAGGAADGGAAPQPEPSSPEQEDGKDEQDPSKDSAKQLLDSLQEQEKALKRKRLEQKLKQKHVEKDW